MQQQVRVVNVVQSDMKMDVPLIQSMPEILTILQDSQAGQDRL